MLAHGHCKNALTVQLEYFDHLVGCKQVEMVQLIIQVSDDDPVAMLSDT